MDKYNWNYLRAMLIVSVWVIWNGRKREEWRKWRKEGRKEGTGGPSLPSHSFFGICFIAHLTFTPFSLHPLLPHPHPAPDHASYLHLTPAGLIVYEKKTQYNLESQLKVKWMANITHAISGPLSRKKEGLSARNNRRRARIPTNDASGGLRILQGPFPAALR